LHRASEARDTVGGISWWMQIQRQEDIRDTVPQAIYRATK